MKLINSLILGLLPAFTITYANASSWNTFARAYNDEALFFFDADTVDKQGDTTTLWVKSVKTKAPDSDGSWSTAYRYVIVCSKRTAQPTSVSLYDREGKFMRAFPKAGAAMDILPDSILEGIHKTVCTTDFPRSKSREQYFPVRDNDIFLHTKNYMDYVESQKDNAPK